jgi:ABC-type Fe3+-citrate transport system substrate-binding protein
MSGPNQEHVVNALVTNIVSGCGKERREEICESHEVLKLAVFDEEEKVVNDFASVHGVVKRVVLLLVSFVDLFPNSVEN